MGYLYLLMGIIVSPTVVPAALTLLWKKQNMWAATISPVAGLACSLTTWLVTTKIMYGDITVASSGQNAPMLAGNVRESTPLLILEIIILTLYRSSPF